MRLVEWAPFYRARFFMMFNRHERAIEALQQALAANPGFGRAASCLGYSYAMLGRDDLAVRYFEQATRTDPDNAATHFDLGFVLDRQNEKERAIAAFERAVALKPTLDRAWYGMGLAHAVLGRTFYLMGFVDGWSPMGLETAADGSRSCITKRSPLVASAAEAAPLVAT